MFRTTLAIIKCLILLVGTAVLLLCHCNVRCVVPSESSCTPRAGWFFLLCWVSRLRAYIEVWRSSRSRQLLLLLQGGHQSLRHEAVIYFIILSEKTFVPADGLNQTTQKCSEKKDFRFRIAQILWQAYKRESGTDLNRSESNESLCRSVSTICRSSIAAT